MYKGQQALRLNIGRTILIGLAFMSICLFWEVYDAVMPLFLKNFPVFANNKTLVGVIMALDNLLALFLLPYMGKLSDDFPKIFKNHPKLLKLGKRIPFIVVGTVLAAITLMLVTLGHETQNLVLMLSATGFLLVSMSLYRSPAVALMPDLTPKPLRSGANAIINIMGVVGGLLSLGLTRAFLKTRTEIIDGFEVKFVDYGAQNWLLMICLAGLMLFSVFILVLTIRENKLLEEKQKLLADLGVVEDEDTLPEQEQNKTENKKGGRLKNLGLTKSELVSLLLLLTAAFLWYMAYNGAKTFYSTFYYEFLGRENFQLPLIIGQLAGFIAFIPAGLLGSVIGRRNTILVGLGTCIFGFILACVMVFTVPRDSVALVNIFMICVFIFVGIGWATINVHSYVMSVEMANKHNTGAFTGLYYSFTMTAQMLTPILVGAITDLSNSFKYMFPYSLILMVLAFIIMLFVRHGNAKPLKKSAIEMLGSED
ncbi:MAG TPA: MFS transporter [Clostridia bacterium]